MSVASVLTATARALVAPGKGILAADESFPTIGKRFAGLEITATEANRRAYRELLFTTPALGDFISGVILFDETLRQRTSDGGATLPEILVRQGIIPGIKVDHGTIPLANFPGEKITQGLDGLRERLAGYRQLGARFTKWRAVIAIGERLPTAACIAANSGPLAQFAALSQEAGLVPIVEPEVLMDGNHTLARCEEVMGLTLQTVFAGLFAHHVALEAMLLKASMVLSGKDCKRQADPLEVAAATVGCLRKNVPAAVPGIVFLSGGQTDLAATERLNAICQVSGAPWTLSFSFGRALQDEAMKKWRGSPSNSPAAQGALLHRARCNALAVLGKYSNAAEDSCRSMQLPPPNNGRPVRTPVHAS
ncbi:MAG: class I fructose-bisphosphate aldolase [Opitutus sp.]